MKKIPLFVVFCVLFISTTLFAATTLRNNCNGKCKQAAVKNTVTHKKTATELAKKAAKVSSSPKNVFPDFIIGALFYKL